MLKGLSLRATPRIDLVHLRDVIEVLLNPLAFPLADQTVTFRSTNHHRRVEVTTTQRIDQLPHSAIAVRT